MRIGETGKQGNPRESYNMRQRHTTFPTISFHGVPWDYTIFAEVEVEVAAKTFEILGQFQTRFQAIDIELLNSYRRCGMFKVYFRIIKL